MRLKEITGEFKESSFEFFYWFSRFEFPLKENHFLKKADLGSPAEPCWNSFIVKYKDQYKISNEAKNLIKLHPKRQIIGKDKLEWKPVGTDHCNSDLCNVITMLTTVRNNLFHGGKHGDVDVDNQKRNIELLSYGKTVLDQLATQFDFWHDYTRTY